MASTNSMMALVISVAALAVVVWAMGESGRARAIYGHSVPESYSVASVHR